MGDCSSIDPLFTPSAATPFRVGFISAFTFFISQGFEDLFLEVLFWELL